VVSVVKELTFVSSADDDVRDGSTQLDLVIAIIVFNELYGAVYLSVTIYKINIGNNQSINQSGYIYTAYP